MRQPAITDGIAEGFFEISSLIRPVVIGKREISGGGNVESRKGKHETVEYRQNHGLNRLING